MDAWALVIAAVGFLAFIVFDGIVLLFVIGKKIYEAVRSAQRIERGQNDRR